jgi:hypothetical protein
MQLPPLEAKRLRFPPGRVAVRLSDQHRRAYRLLYGRYESYLQGLPVLRDRDFDGRPVRMSEAEFEALKRGFERLSDHGVAAAPPTPFLRQEAEKERLFKRLQFLS